MTSTRREERYIKSLDEKLEMDQLLKFFTVFPIEEDLLYIDLLEHKKILEGLLYQGAITIEQLDILLPHSKHTDFTKLDFQLLHVLVYRFTDLLKPVTGWKEEPLSDDLSESACYIRIYLARKAISETKQPVPYPVYQGIFNYVRQSLLDLGHERGTITSLSIPLRFNVYPHQFYFVARKEEVSEVYNCFFERQSQDHRSIVVLYGSDGFGKREIVREYIRVKGYLHDDNAIWLNSFTDSTLKKSVYDLCATLGLTLTNSSGSRLDLVQMIENVHSYLQNTKTLFIFENVKSFEQVRDLLPKNELSSTIIISKNKFCVRKFHHVFITKFSLPQADEYLKKNLPFGGSFNTDELRKYLAKALRFNPLALTIAVAFIKRSATYTWEFIVALKTVIKENIPKQIQNEAALVPVFAAFYLTCNALSENEVAFQILNLLSYLSSSGIKRSLIEDILSHSDWHISIYELNEAFDLLACLSLITIQSGRTRSEETIFIHCSIQEVNRIYQIEYMHNKSAPFHSILDYMFKYSGYHRQRHYECGENWIEHLLHIFETKAFHSNVLLRCKQNQQFIFDVFSSKGQCEDLLAILSKLENICDKNSRDRYTIKINIAKCYQQLGNKNKALSEFELIERRLTRLFGNDDAMVIETKFLRAYLMYKQKRGAAALDLCNQVLNQISILSAQNDQLQVGLDYLFMKCTDICGIAKVTLDQLETFRNEKLRVFQQYHPYVFRVQHDIAKFHLRQGDFVKAIEELRQLEANQTEVFGHCHMDTLKTQKKLAHCYMKLGKCDQAMPILMHIKTVEGSIHGSEHPTTMKSELGYAFCLQEHGRMEDAIELLYRIETILENNQSTFSIDDIIQSKYNVANCLQSLGYFDQALLKFQDIEGILKKHHGENHRDIYVTKHYIATCLHDMGRMDRAASLYKSVAEIQRNFLGDNHEDVLRTQHNLSVCLIDSCQEKRAFKELKEIEEKQKASTAQNTNPEILVTQTNMAMCLHKRQFYDRALHKYQDILNTQKQYFDDKNQVILLLKHHIAICLHDKGKYLEAMKKYEEVYEIQCQTIGLDHPDTLRTRYNKAICNFESKKYKVAFQELEAVEMLQLDVLGEHHPDTKRTQTSLNICGRDYPSIMRGPGSMCTIL